MSVLVVDDEPSVRGLLSAILEDLGLEVSSCASGDEAWAMLEERPRDMLITDWMMPGLHGPDLVRRIRLSEQFPGIYVMIVTGRAASADRVEGLEAGADDFLAKPFEEAELRVRVRAGQRILHLRKHLLEQNRLLQASNAEMSRELRAAGNLQLAMLPPGPARVPGFDCAWAFHPCSHASGDMFGVFPLDERHVGIFLIDVSGHGMAAAMLAFTLARLLIAVPGQDSLVKRRLPTAPFYEIIPPAEVLKGLRDWFQCHETSGFYSTLLYAVLNGPSGELQWVSAGHHPPIGFLSGKWKRCRQEFAQTPVGLPIEPHGETHSNRMSLEPGERVFFYSDGLVDLRDPQGEWLPQELLGEAIAETSSVPIAGSVDEVVGRLRKSSGRASFEDDVTLIGLERRRAA